MEDYEPERKELVRVEKIISEAIQSHPIPCLGMPRVKGFIHTEFNEREGPVAEGHRVRGEKQGRSPPLLPSSLRQWSLLRNRKRL
jgi:hypothetical protein